MTTFDRFDPFERRIGEAIHEIAAPRTPDYLTDVLRQTARTAQRPRWSFLERWLPVDTTLSRPTVFGRLPLRQMIVVALLLALAATLAVFVGSQRKLAPPFGPAGNGSLVYRSNGDLYVRDSLTGAGRLIVGSPYTEDFAGYTPDGSHLTYVSTHDDGDHLMVANADGTAPVAIAVIPATGNATGAVSPDGKTFALVFDVGGIPTLTMAAMDGSTSRVIGMNPMWPLDVSWSPPAGDRLLLRIRGAIGEGVDLYTMKPDGSELHALGLPGTSAFGPSYTLSGAGWAPDGKTVAYNGVEVVPGLFNDDGTAFQHFRLHLVAPDGSNDRAIPGPTDPKVQENWPLYSPDGKWIVAQRWSFENTAGGLVLIPADGSGPGREIGPQDVGGNLGKVWAPDGSRILMAVQDAGSEKVYSIDPTTGASEELSWTTGLPDWQRVALP